jgi:four helix bundle protein
VASNFRLLDVARGVVDEVNDLLDSSRRRLLHDGQLRDAAGSITANIREAYGRREGAERNQFFRFARGSAEETAEHLRTTLLQSAWRTHDIGGCTIG